MSKINQKNIPEHVVVIPDGNRRWARQRGLMPWLGHRAGAKTSEKVAQAALDLGIPCFSLWVGSWENLTKRPKIEVNFLFELYEQYFKKLAKNKEVHKNQVKINLFGRWKEILPKNARRAAEEVIRVTKNYRQRYFNLFVAYNGTDEIMAMVESILKKARDKKIKVTPELIRENLWTSQLPPVDFLIRTGSRGDPHNSTGFMMWHCANSQLYFTKEFYPDFGYQEFVQAIKEYQKRERRMGK